ncbi:MAG: helix-turn-helix transcriptional regulator [Clostridia bacterium]|nr:helix-turn-helix transcriptional regulator [Clostridia bacterium]
MKTKRINGKLNIIGKNLKKYRELRGLTQRELSQKLELYGLTIYHTDIHNIEHGNKTIRDYEIKGLCLALNISLDDIYEDTDKEYE